jgi:hypothetical protein
VAGRATCGAATTGVTFGYMYWWLGILLCVQTREGSFRYIDVPADAFLTPARR